MINLKVDKIANKSYLFLNNSNLIRYSVTITNLGDEKACFIRMRDVLSKGSKILPNTLLINCCKSDLKICNGFLNIGCIDPNESLTVSFEVEVDKECPPYFVKNKAIITYFDANTNLNTIESNEVLIPVVDVDVCILKTSDKEEAVIGDTISYSIIIRNRGTVDVEEVVFYDDLSATVELLPGTVTVNSIPQFIDSFEDGLKIGTIKSKGNIIINFDVVVMHITKSILCNVAKAYYEFKVLEYGREIISSGESASNCNKIFVYPEIKKEEC